MTEETLEKLAQLLEQDQFELLIPEKMRTESGRISDKASASMDIPLVYLMNDAFESFLVFRNVRMMGEYHSTVSSCFMTSTNLPSCLVMDACSSP